MERWRALAVWAVLGTVCCRSPVQRAATSAPSERAARASAAPSDVTPGAPSDALARGERTTTLLFVRIPEAIMPVDRGRKYEDPLNELLQQRGLGEVSGGGSGLNADGSIEYVGVDLDVFDARQALPIVIHKLRELGVPKGTVIEEDRGDDAEPIKHPVW